MASGISFGGFNGVDFTVVINAIMKQASQPITALQTKQTGLQSQLGSFSALASRVSAVQTAADALSSSDALSSFSASVSDTTALSATTSSDSVAGRYSVVVDQLAQSQVTASGVVADTNSTVIADSGTLTINGKDVQISSGTTLQGLAKAINNTSGIGVTAAVVQTGTSAYKLVLTGTSTGEANAFTVSNGLTLAGGAAGIGFTGPNAVEASDAKLTVNNIAITSASNRVSAAVPGTTLNLLKKTTSPIVVDVSTDSSGLQAKLQNFISAYNTLQKFASDQTLAATAGNPGSIARDPAMRGIRDTLRHTLTGKFGTDTLSYLSEMGVEFTRTGTLQFNASRFNAVTKDGTAALKRLLVGSSDTAKDGVFSIVATKLEQFTQSSGVITQSQKRINDQISRLDDQVIRLQARLDLQRAALVKEYAAADNAMSQLKGQSGALSSFGSNTSSSSTSNSNS